MKIMIGSGRNNRARRVCVFIIAVALIAVAIGCSATQYELTMEVNPEEGGTAIDLTGTSPYEADAKVNIKAEANPGYRFVKWTAPAGTFDDEEATETSFTMPAQPIAVTANFVAVYELNMTAEPDAGGTAIDLTGTSPYEAGVKVNIKAEANPGYRFINWTAPAGTFDDEEATETTFTMPAQPIAVTANFIAVYELNMTAEPDAGGEAIDVAGLGAYPVGAEVEIRAEANEGWTFASWISAPEGIIDDEEEAETFLTMPAQNVTITANFILFAGGNGTAEDPYQIADWRHLDNVRNYLSNHFIIINDLDSHTAGYTELASVTANEGKGWQPIGNNTENGTFTGSFDGQGYKICDLFIDRPDESDVGLFGVVDEVGTIENVGVVNGNVTGKDDAGGLVGKNEGTVSNSYSTGSITGHDDIGGLVGKNEGTVSNSYSTGSVTGHDDIGGLVGANSDTVERSFWDTETSGQVISSGGTGKTTEEMQDIDTFTDAGWDIVLIGDYVDETWYIDAAGNDYPRLGWQFSH